MATNHSKHTKRRLNQKEVHNESYKKLAFIIVLIIIVILIAIIFKPSKKTEISNNKIQIIINNEDKTEELAEEIIKENGKIYMSLDDVKNYFDNTIYQEENGEIITTSERKVACLGENREDVEINGSTQKAENVVLEKDEKKYIAISELENVYDYEYKYIENTNKVIIDKLNKKIVKAQAKKEIKVKKENKVFSETIEKIKKGEEVIYIQEEGNMVKIRTQNGNIGYVKSKQLENIETQREDFEEKQSEIKEEEYLEYDITKEDITTYEKRKKVIDIILQEAIKNDKMYIKIKYDKEQDEKFERFMIEVKPMLKECGLTVEI